MARRRSCRFTAEGVKEIDYKDLETLKAFITETGKIVPARASPVPTLSISASWQLPSSARVSWHSCLTLTSTKGEP